MLRARAECSQAIVHQPVLRVDAASASEPMRGRWIKRVRVGADVWNMLTRGTINDPHGKRSAASLHTAHASSTRHAVLNA